MYSVLLGLGNISIKYHNVIWDKISWQILDIDVLWYGVSVVFFWLKGFITVKWCDVFLNLPDCFYCSFIYPYPLIHITDDCLSKKCHWVIFCEISNSHPYNTTSVLRYLVKNIVIFTHLSPQLLQPLRMHKSSVATYIINNYRYGRYETSLSQ